TAFRAGVSVCVRGEKDRSTWRTGGKILYASWRPARSTRDNESGGCFCLRFSARITVALSEAYLFLADSQSLQTSETIQRGRQAVAGAIDSWCRCTFPRQNERSAGLLGLGLHRDPRIQAKGRILVTTPEECLALVQPPNHQNPWN